MGDRDLQREVLINAPQQIDVFGFGYFAFEVVGAVNRELHRLQTAVACQLNKARDVQREMIDDGRDFEGI